MYLGRIKHVGPDGEEPRVVVAASPAGPWIDLRQAERLRLERTGASSASAVRIARALVPSDLTASIEGGDSFVAAADAALERKDDATIIQDNSVFLAPLQPTAYRDFMAFEEHFSFGYRWRNLDVPDVLYEFPVSYMGSAHSFLGPEEEIPWPHYSEQMDYELELGIVIGRSGKNIDPSRALDHVLGLTILNDFSARDIQMREMSGGLGPCKGKHFASAIGPWIMTIDEFPTEGLKMTSRVNGEVWCEASSKEMIWSIAEIVAWASAAENLAAGTLLGSGTANGGSGVEISRFLSPGDEVELEIERIGVLRNRMGAPSRGWMPEPRSPESERTN